MAASRSQRTPILAVAAVLLFAGLAAVAWLVLGDDGGNDGGAGVVAAPEATRRAVEVPAPPDERPDPAPVEGLAAAARPSGVESIARTTFGDTGTIEGRALDDTIPVPGVTVALYKGHANVSASFTALRDRMDGFTAVTDGDGWFVFEHVPVGAPYVILGEHDSFARSEIGGLRVEKGRATTGVLLHMTRGARIGGRVVDLDSSSPIPDARVELYHTMDLVELVRNPGGTKRPYKVVLTDHRGRYEFPHVSEPSIRIQVSAEGHESQSRGVNFSLEGEVSDRDNIDFKLGLGRTLSGRVIDTDGAGIVDAKVSAIARTKDFQGDGEAFTDRAGYFLVEGLGDHPYMLRVEARGYTDGTLPNVSVGSADVLVTLDRRVAIAGHVVDMRGDPIPSFAMHLMRTLPGRPPNYMEDRREFSAADGAFLFDDIDPGSWVLEARADGYADSRSGEVTVSRSDPAPPEIVIQMGRGGTVRGSVRDSAGKPVRGATVTLRENRYVENAISRIFGQLSPRVQSEPTARTGTEGGFEIAFVAPGTYQVAVDHPGWAPAAVNDVVVVDDDVGYNGPVEVTLPAGATLCGRALDDSGEVYRFARVQVSRVGEGATFMETTTTDGNGEWRFENLVEGTYRLALSPDKDPSGKQMNPIMMLVYSQNSSQEVFVRAGQVLCDLTLYLKRGP